MAQEILAPMAGKVFEILVAVGESVEEDDETIIIEAMKMETPILAPCDGIIREIRVKAGDVVGEDAVLAVIEPARD